MRSAHVDPVFWKGKKVFLTGHTGFKGSWLSLWLSSMGAKLTGYALAPNTTPNLFNVLAIDSLIEKSYIADIRDLASLQKAMSEAKPDIVIHMAAQPLVRYSYANPVETYTINVLGTVHVLEATRSIESARATLVVTTDKCYENKEWVWGYRETDPMGGPDPYSASKGAAELVIRSHIKSYFPKGSSQVRIASARAGNVIGGGDWSVNRIIPDCIKAWSNGESVDLRNPHSTRPWQHVLEPLGGYLTLGIALFDNPGLHAEPCNFGPQAQQNHSVLQLVQEMAMHWKRVQWKDVSDLVGGPYESGLLKLNCDKALHFLNWHAVMGFEDTVQMTAEWYKTYYENPELILKVTENQIHSYTKIAARNGLAWAK